MKTTIKVRALNSICVALIAVMITTSARAEYYMVYPASCVDCNVCHTCKKRPVHRPCHVKKHHVKYKCYKRHYVKYTCYKPYRKYHRTCHRTPRVEVYHYRVVPACYNPCRGYYGCAPCRSRAIVTFSGAPTSWENTYNYDTYWDMDPRFQDRATTDDDAYAYPDMNIDY